MDHTYEAPPIPRAFIMRRAHSLTGLWLVLFLMEHLFTNSQAALLIADEGSGFVQAVNAIKSLPYLPVIEVVLLGIPFIFHALWGIHTLYTARYNSFPTDGSSPALPNYSRNQAYTWQRITSWILLIGIIAHVVHMRFIEYPTSIRYDDQQLYVNRIEYDQQLKDLESRLHIKVYDREEIERLQSERDQQELKAAIEKWTLQENERIALSPSFGAAELLVVRETFKSPLMVFLYTGFVLAACFHAFNGLWTFMITWGVTLTARSQVLMRYAAVTLMVLINFLGLAAIWGSYWR